MLGSMLAGCAMVPAAPPGAAPLPMQERHSEWSDSALPGKRNTRYTPLVIDGRPVVHAAADSAASLYRRKLRLESTELVTVRFSWRVQDLIGAADLNDRDSDDSPVRVILAFDGDHGRLSLRNRMTFELAQAVTGEQLPFATLMYVWDNKAPLESVIHNRRTDRIRKIVLDSGAGQLGHWRHHERDIAADFRRTFGEDPGALISVGLMTDSDNTRSSAEAWYGEVLFAAPDKRIR